MNAPAPSANTRQRLSLVLGLFAVVANAAPTDAPAPIFDAHIHYSHDAWDGTPPPAAVARLREAGIGRALVSSSPDEGTQKLLAQAPDLVIPVLRPYRARGELGSWMNDASVIPYLEGKLARQRYAGIGEFHVSGAGADLPVVRAVVALAEKHQLWLHAHSDADAIKRLYRQQPDLRILWAHAGFEPPEVVREMLDRHPNLVADLSFRGELASGDKVTPSWRALLIDHADRFLLGTDTYTPSRWSAVGDVARSSRAWLSDLPPPVAARIRWDNGERLFVKPWQTRP